MSETAGTGASAATGRNGTDQHGTDQVGTDQYGTDHFGAGQDAGTGHSVTKSGVAKGSVTTSAVTTSAVTTSAVTTSAVRKSAVTEANVTEAYAFACMSCGHGWEQGYEIEHHQDASGVQFVTYLADGAQVPSPLTRPSCLNCDGHTVRIMRSGQVSDVASLWTARRNAPAERRVQPVERRARAHHWSVLNFLHHRHEGDADSV